MASSHTIHTDTCPCGSNLSYAACCAPLHDSAAASDALALMRSRYAAFVLGKEDYLLTSWHERTRPERLGLSDETPAPTWLGLKILRHEQEDADHACVEFVARYRVGGGRALRLHESSRFVRAQGRWYYVDGDVIDG